MTNVVTLHKNTKEQLLEIIDGLPENTSFMVHYHKEIDGKTVPGFHFVGEMDGNVVLASTIKLQHQLLKGQ